MKPNEIKTVGIPIKAYSMKEIAELYDVSRGTMRSWLIPFKNEIGLRRGHYFNPKQMKVIFEKLGIPEIIM